MIDHMKEALGDAQRNLQRTQMKNIRQANKSRRVEEFEEGRRPSSFINS